MRYGPVTNSTYGSVMRANSFMGLAPSSFAASNKSLGIFMRTPVVMSMVYGTPIHKFTISTEKRGKIESCETSVSHPILSLIIPKSISTVLSGPSICKKFDIVSSVINCGMAIVITKIVRNTGLPTTPLRLISMARNIPAK